jgi:hypothetical protein
MVYNEEVGSETPNVLPAGKPSDTIRDDTIRFGHALIAVYGWMKMDCEEEGSVANTPRLQSRCATAAWWCGLGGTGRIAWWFRP